MATDPLGEFRATVPAEYWQTVLSIISESMECAHEHGPDRWGIRINRSAMLKVGPHEVLQIGPWPRPCHLVVATGLVPSDLRTNSALIFSGDRDWHGNRQQSGYYASQEGTEACDFGFAQLDDAYRQLRQAHFAAISRAATMRRHSSTVRSHSAAFVELVASITGRALSQPTYGDANVRRSGDREKADAQQLHTDSDSPGYVLHSGDRQTERTHEWSVSLTVEQYVSGLRAIESRMNDTQCALLVCQYRAPSRTVYATELARIADVRGGHPAVNAQYGRLGHMFCDATSFQADRRGNNDHRWWAVWSRGHPTSKGYVWEMLPAVAAALESLGWVGPHQLSDSGAHETEPREDHALAATQLDGACLTDSDHYVAYHSVDLMGREYSVTGDTFSHYSRKPESSLRKVIGNWVWVIVGKRKGEGKETRYRLAGVYVPEQIAAQQANWLLEGRGVLAPDGIDVTDLPWFSQLFREQSKFSFGLNRIRSAEVIDALRNLVPEHRTLASFGSRALAIAASGGVASIEASFAYDEAFPLIARLIMRAAKTAPGMFIPHDAIVDLILVDERGAEMAAHARGRSSWNDDRAAASNMVAWFSQQISIGRSEWLPLFERKRINDAWAYRPAVTEVLGQTAGSELAAIEGEPRMFFHVRRERDQGIAEAKRAAARNAAGELQ